MEERAYSAASAARLREQGIELAALQARFGAKPDAESCHVPAGI
jgi:hypothetical protein